MDRREALGALGSAAMAFAAAPWIPARGKEAAMDPLLTRPIPSSGEALPVVGMGTWQTFDVGPSREERDPLEEVLRAFAELGGRLVDSSPMYGRSEEVVGALAGKLGLRPALFLATKVWTAGKAEGIRQMEDSMRKLRADPIDLIQVHNLVDTAAHLDTLARWKKEGRVRYLGVTHYTASAHGEVARAMTSHSLDFIQINYSAGERDAEKKVLPLARDKGVAVIANRPFAGGGLLRRLRGKPLPAWASEIDCASWAQVLLKFALSHPAVTCAIPATSKAAHLRDNMGAGLGRFPDAALRARIAAEAV